MLKLDVTIAVIPVCHIQTSEHTGPVHGPVVLKWLMCPSRTYIILLLFIIAALFSAYERNL